MSATRPHWNARDQTLFQAHEIARGAVAVDHDLLVGVVEAVERVEELLLGRLLPERNWMSSMRSRSRLRYRSRNSRVVPARIDSIISFMNVSEETYCTRALGLRCLTAKPIACMMWVFPRPTPP